MFEWNTQKRPIIALAPMAGVTDAAYRQLIKSMAQEVIIFTEFVSSDAIHYKAKKTMKMLQFDPDIERPFIVQVFGKNKEHFASACKQIEEMGADGIDINMGCPAARVVSSCHGSALIRKPELAAELVHSAVSGISIPVSVKTRLGWENSETLIPFCKGLVEAGAKAISIHGRTYTQKYGGEADWNPIYDLKKEISVPVIGNGDIFNAKDAVDKLGNLDGVMVGRGTIGNPWLMKEISDAFKNNLISATETRSFDQILPTIIKHCELSVKCKGEPWGIIVMRKHLAKYVRGFDGAKEVRMRLMGAETLNDVKNELTR
jgi:tRNA-dihydrouridine synthase B